MNYLETMKKMLTEAGIEFAECTEYVSPHDPNMTGLRVNKGWGRIVEFWFDRHGMLLEIVV